jgi:tRNA (adenine37-N6)-methyltransferase
MRILELSTGAIFGALLVIGYYKWTEKEQLNIDTQPKDSNIEKSTLNETHKEEQNKDIHEHYKQRIHAERTGRINAEKALRAGVVEKISNTGYPLLVIGKVESPFLGRRGTPRQGLLVPDSRSIVKLSAEIPKETLLGLDQYSHMFVQFLFHENTNLLKTLSVQSGTNDDTALNSRTSGSKSSTFTKRVNSFASKVLPPLLQGGSIGVFASRSPHRPNALGLSLVKIVSVDIEKRLVIISGADLVNGTPIVDLKPWGPFDCPTCLHNTVDHQGILPCGGSENRCKSFVARIPDWVEYGLKHPYVLPVEWKSVAKDALVEIVDGGHSKFYRAGETQYLIDTIEEMLGLDIRSVHQGRGTVPKSDRAKELIGDSIRGTNSPGQAYEVEFDSLHIHFCVHNGGHDIHQRVPWIEIDSVKVKSVNS